MLEKRFRPQAGSITVKLAPDLIGGVRVVVGDEVLDTSVKARLEQMKVGPHGLTKASGPGASITTLSTRKESCNSIPQKFLN
jgi:hypothetical protein